MNKVKRRVFFLWLAMVVFVIVGYQTWRLFKIREHLQNAVKAQLETALARMRI